MFCHTCGTQVSSEVQFCPNCGQSLGAVPGAPGGAPPAPWTAPAGVRAQPGRWIGAGWDMVKADIGMFLALALVFSLISSAVPVIIQGPMLAGFHIFCMKKILNRRAEFADLFTGFNFFVPALVASLVISLFVSLGFILCIIPGLVLTAMYVFTYLFIVDKRMDFWQAMQASHAVVRNDYFGFTMYIVLCGLVILLGVLCCIIGVFVALPVTIAATTVAYKEVVGFEPRTVTSL